MKLLCPASLLLLIILPFNLFAQKTTIIKKSGHIDSAQIFKLVYIPVAVTAGVTEIRVKQEYTKPGKNVLNMGIYGPEGYNTGNTRGFRGWSGGAKKEFFINAADASTGYIPGKITPGTWNILIYPSTMITEGLDWVLEITLIKGGSEKTFESKKAKEVVNHTPGWYTGDLHMHTLHSDGKRTQQELVNEAADKKLDFIISTEHNTNSANITWGYYDKPDLLIINGEEVTTTEFGHWNAIGINTNTLVEWRYSPTDNVIGKYVNQVHRDGGLCIINHPFYTPAATNGFGFDAALFDGIEVWNGNWDMLDEKDLQWWDSLLQQDLHILAIGASDTHKATGSQNNLGTPRTVVYANGLSKKEIIAGLKSGNTYITEDNGIKLNVNASTSSARKASLGQTLLVKNAETVTVTLQMSAIPNAVVNLISNTGNIATQNADKDQYSWEIKPSSAKYVRIEVRNKQGKMLALTNPIWLKH